MADGPVLEPDAVLELYQWEIGGLVLGPTTAYSVRKWDGLQPPPIVASDPERPSDDGAFFGRDRLAKRVIELSDVLVLGPEVGDYAESGMAYRDALVAAWKIVRTGNVALRFRRPQHGTRRVYGRPRNIAVAEPKGIVYGILEAELEFECADPRIYADELSSITLSPNPTNVGTLGFPVVFPVVFGGGGSSNVFAAVNAGTHSTRPTITIAGPCANPRVVNQSVSPTEPDVLSSGAGASLSLGITLGDTDQVVIDVDGRSVVLNGIAQRRDILQAGSTWWELPPGESSIAFYADSTTGTAQVTWRSAWL